MVGFTYIFAYQRRESQQFWDGRFLDKDIIEELVK